MKYPKRWNGPSPVGEALVRALERTGAPYLTAMTADGVTARKRGQFSDVLIDDPQPALFSLGDLGPLDGSEPTYYLSTARRVTGSYRKAGKWRGGAFGAFATPSIVYTGGGFGVVPERVGDHTHALYKTRNGKTFTKLVEFSYFTDRYSSLIFYVQGAGRVQGDWQLYVEMLGTTATAYQAWYVFSNDRGKSWSRLTVGLGPGYRLGYPTSHPVRPGVIQSIIPVHTSGNEWWRTPPMTEQTNPALSLVVTISDGMTSVEQGRGGDLTEAFSTAFVGPGVHGFNDLLGYWANTLSCTPLDTGDILWLANEQIYTAVLSGDSITTTNRRLFAFRGPVGGPFNQIGTLELPGVDYVAGYSIVVGGTVLVLLASARVSDATPPWLIELTPDGGTEVRRTELPWPRGFVGKMQPIDENTIVVNVYDKVADEYIVMRSERTEEVPFAAEWVKHATIRRPPEDPTNPETPWVPADRQPRPTDVILRRFASFSWVRQGALPAPLRPGQPWLGDDRITPPWELP